MKRLIYGLERRLTRGLKWITAALIAWMVVLSMVQVLLRWLMDINLMWADVQLRTLVLFIAVCGGALSAAYSKHISIDLLRHLLPEQHKAVHHRLISAISAVLAAILAVIALRFVTFEQSTGAVLRGIFFGSNALAWWFELVLPLGLALMTLFFVFHAIAPERTSEEGR